MLVVWLKKLTVTQKINEIEKKITDHSHDKYITTPEFNKITAENFAVKLAQANFVTKTDFDDKLKNLNKKITSNKIKYVFVENELKKIETFDSVYFRGISHFDNDGTQNYLAFQTAYRCLKAVSINDNNILSWKSKGLSDESIKPPSMSNKILNPSVNYVSTKARVKFHRDCLKQDKI